MSRHIVNGVYSFPGKHRHETILLVFRKHWLIHVYAVIRFLIIGALPLGAGIIGLFYFQQAIGSLLFWSGIAFWLLGLALALELSLMHWMDDDLNILIVTNERAIEASQKGLLSRVIAEMGLSRVQDVSGEVRGIFGNLFNFGDIGIRTASTYPDFCLSQIPNPHICARQLLDLVDGLGKRQKTSGQSLQ